MQMTRVTSSQVYALDELNKETTFGGAGWTKSRAIPQIDMSDFAVRKGEIADQLWQASTEIGFFQLINHGIPQQQMAKPPPLPHARSMARRPSTATGPDRDCYAPPGLALR